MRGATRRSRVLRPLALMALAAATAAEAYDPNKAATLGRSGAVPPPDGGVAIAALKTPAGGTVSATNGVVTIDVEDTAATGGVGVYSWSFNGGAGYTSPTRILYPLGTTYNTIRSYTTQTDYVQINGSPASAFTVVNLDPYGAVTPLGPTGFRTTYTLPGPATTPDALTIVTDVVIHGSSWSNTSVEVTTVVTNNGQTPVLIGIRYMWDVTLLADDGPTFQAISPNGAVLSTETDFAAPAFQSYVLRDNDDGFAPWPGYLAIGGTVSGPPWILPSPTIPGLLQFASWSGAYFQAFNYTSSALTIATAGAGNDSAVVYYFPSDVASYTIAAGNAASCTASMFFHEQPVGGPYPIPALGVAGLVGLAVLLAVAAALALRGAVRA